MPCGFAKSISKQEILVFDTAAGVVASASMCSGAQPGSLQNCSTLPCEDRDVLAVPKGSVVQSTSGNAQPALCLSTLVQAFLGSTHSLALDVGACTEHDNDTGHKSWVV